MYCTFTYIDTFFLKPSIEILHQYILLFGCIAGIMLCVVTEVLEVYYINYDLACLV